MNILTLAFLFRGDKIILAMKKRDFGNGKWNGYGGKLEKDEKPIDGIVREIKEESGLIVESDQCRELGYMDFSFTDKEEWNQRVIVYRIDDFIGEPKETDEMMPRWFDIDKIPYDEMWAGDDEWIPNVIKNKNFKGRILFSDEGKKVVSCVVE